MILSTQAPNVNSNSDSLIWGVSGSTCPSCHIWSHCSLGFEHITCSFCTTCTVPCTMPTTITWMSSDSKLLDLWIVLVHEIPVSCLFRNINGLNKMTFNIFYCHSLIWMDKIHMYLNDICIRKLSFKGEHFSWQCKSLTVLNEFKVRISTEL